MLSWIVQDRTPPLPYSRPPGPKPNTFKRTSTYIQRFSLYYICKTSDIGFLIDSSTPRLHTYKMDLINAISFNSFAVTRPIFRKIIFLAIMPQKIITTHKSCIRTWLTVHIVSSTNSFVMPFWSSNIDVYKHRDLCEGYS